MDPAEDKRSESQVIATWGPPTTTHNPVANPQHTGGTHPTAANQSGEKGEDATREGGGGRACSNYI